MPDRLIIRELGELQEYRGPCSPSHVEMVHGEFALSALRHATAEEMLVALRGLMPSEAAKALVELLVDADLLFDSIIESELDQGSPYAQG